MTPDEIVLLAEKRHAEHIGYQARRSANPDVIVYVCYACWSAVLSEALQRTRTEVRGLSSRT